MLCSFSPPSKFSLKDLIANNSITVSFRPQPQADVIDESSLPTLDTIKPKVRAKPEEPSQSEVAAAAATATQPDDLADVNTAAASKDVQVSEGGLASAEELESEASQEAAFNPETGEINWDCPCLGGMAHGPCGEEFKAAFSCFVYSNEEPKGIDCIEKFKSASSLELLLFVC